MITRKSSLGYGARFALSVLLTLWAGFAIAEPPKILVLGDSLSAGYGIKAEQGWVNLMQRKIVEAGHPHKVVNASYSGETSGGGLERLPKQLKLHQPSWVIVELGGNDGLRGYPTQKLKGNLESIITLSQSAGAKVLLLGMQIPPNYGRTYTAAFSKVYRSLADEYKLPLVPFFLANIATDPALMQADRIHPTAKAQPMMMETVWEILGPLL